MVQARQVANVLDELEHAGPSGPSLSTIVKFLRLVREQKIRQSDAVAKFGLQLLQSRKHGLSQDEAWTVREQVAMACLDCHDVKAAYNLIDAILARFPDTQRAHRVMGMYYECTGRTADAVDLYDKCLEEQPNQPLLLKRLVAIKRAAGDLPGAIERLGEYVQVQPLDAEAWEELADLYLQAQMYQQAAFCYEELIIANPGRMATQVKYADVLYTLGGAANLKMARTYYSAALQLTEGQGLRALYGLCATAEALAACKERDARAAEPEGAADLGPLAAERLVDKYARECPSKLPLVQATLRGMGMLR